MKIYYATISTAIVLTQTPFITAFSSPATTAFLSTRSNANALSNSASTGSSKLNMAGIEGKRVKKEETANPEEKVSAYVQPPGSLEPRANLSGKVLVSGYVNQKDRVDQQVFDILNNHDGVSAFDFENIIAFCDDATFAKKRLLSRSARYNGLLDKLELKQASQPGALPSSDDLKGVSCWVAQLDAVTVSDVAWSVDQIITLASGAGVENVTVMIVNSHTVDASAIQSLNAKVGDGITISFVSEMDDSKKEGSHPYSIVNVDSVAEEVSELCIMCHLCRCS